MPKAVLDKVSRDQIPPGAKILTRSEVTEEYWKILMNWKPKSDIWPVYYGIPVLGFATFFTNFSMLRHYRRCLKLGRQGFMMMSATCCMFPSLFAPFVHAGYVTNPIILGESCAVCAQTTGMTIQCLLAFGQSLTITPALCLMKAQLLCTYNVPGYTTKETFFKTLQLYKKFTKRAAGKIYLYILINSILATAITTAEYKCITNLNETLFNKEKEVKQVRQQLSELSA